MVAFATLFLGLVFGTQNVDLVVAPEVAAVDIVLDGELVSTLREPPWTARLDLGAEPAPRLLEAIAYDDLFVEIGRSSQWVNVPREPAELELAVENSPTGRAASARLAWESLSAGEPTRLAMSFDGRPVEIGDPLAIDLPDHDPELLHFIRAEVEFQGALTASAEVVFGGTFADDTSAALTAIVVETQSRRRLTREHLRNRFRRDGAVLEVAAVEKDVAEIVVVRTPAASAWAAELGPPPPRVVLAPQSGPGSQGLLLPWRDDWQAQMLWPLTQRASAGRQAYDLFPHSQRMRPEDGELAALVRMVQAPPLTGALRTADAVAIAGLTAAAGSHRRIVLLVLGEDAVADSSELKPAVTRRFLARLGVPLAVWSFGSASAPNSQWGTVTHVGSGRDLEVASRALLKRLERQRVVWLHGDHPASQVEIDESGGVSLAGATPR